MLENEKAKLIWDFQYKVRKTKEARRPDLVLEKKENKVIWLCDMACPKERNIEAKSREKITKYQQLAYETREKRKNYEVNVIPLIIGSLGGGVNAIQRNIENVLTEKTAELKMVKEMQKTVLMESESIVRKVISGVIQAA